VEIKEIDKTFIRCEGQNSVIMCLKSLLQYFNISIKQEELKEKLILDDKGNATLAELSKTLERFGLITEGFRAEAVSNMDELTNPAIVPIYLEDGRQDFAVYYGKQENRYLIGLPFWGLNLYTDWEFEAFWYNHILLEVREF